MPDATTALLAELGEPADVLRRLDPDEAATLLALVRAARRIRQQRLETAVDDAIGVLPRLVRIPARKILFGK